MRLTFAALRWRNFLSTGNYWLEIPLNNTQNTLVVGENGSGKSTMLDALTFVLYGVPFRDINKAALINSINQRECTVEVEFSTDSHQYKVVRGIKPTIFEIHCDGELLNQDAAGGDYQDYLEKFILKLNYKSFTQIVILGSASFTPFMQLAAQERRSIVEDLLDILIFSVMNKLAKTEMTSLGTQKTENKILIDTTIEKIKMQERYIAEVQQDAEEVALGLRGEYDHNEKELIKYKAEVLEAQANIDALTPKIVDKAKITAALKKVTQLEAQIENVLAKDRKKIDFYHENNDCPTCSQVIGEEFKAAQFKDLESKTADYAHGLKELEVKFLGHQKQMQAIEENEKSIAEQRSLVIGFSNNVTLLERLNIQLSEKIKGLTENHRTTEREQTRLVEHQEEQVRLEESRKRIVESIAYYEAAGTLLKDTGIKTKIIRQYLPIINTLVNKYLASLDFFVNFNLDETFKETIKSRHRDEFTYHSFSEGEKQRIDMAILLTWRAVAKLKNSADTNLLILDEIFDSSIDNAGAEELMKILHALEATNVMVISHRGDLLQDKFQSVIKFTKQQNFSRITQ